MLQIITDTRAWALETKYFSLVKGTVLHMMQEGTLTTENFTSQKKDDLPLPEVLGVSAAGLLSAATPLSGFEAAAKGSNYKGDGSEDVNVAIVPLRGALTKYGGMCSYGTKDIRSWLADAVNNPNIGAIVLLVDSPGGAVDGNEDLANDIREARKTKPVVGFVDGMAASAAYWNVAQTDHIFINAETTAWVGSIGTLVAHVDQSAFLEKQGLKVTYITADASVDKVKGNSTMPLDEEAIAMFKTDLNAINDTFIAAVKAGRGDKLAEQSKWDSAKVFNGKEGIALGLVDQVGTLQDAIRKAASLAQGKGKSNSKKQSSNNSEMKFATGFASSFPRLAAALGFSANQENVEVTEESLKTAEAAIEQAQQATASAEAAKATVEASLASANATITALTTERDSYKTEAETLRDWKATAEGKNSPEGDESTEREGAPKKVAAYNQHAQSIIDRKNANKH